MSHGNDQHRKETHSFVLFFSVCLSTRNTNFTSSSIAPWSFHFACSSVQRPSRRRSVRLRVLCPLSNTRLRKVHRLVLVKAVLCSFPPLISPLSSTDRVRTMARSSPPSHRLINIGSFTHSCISLSPLSIDLTMPIDRMATGTLAFVA